MTVAGSASVRVMLELKGTPGECSRLVDFAEKIGLDVVFIRSGAVDVHFEILTTEELKAIKTDLRRAQLSASGLRSVTRRRRILNRETNYPTSGSSDELVPISTMSSLCDRVAKLTARNRKLRNMNETLREQLRKLREDEKFVPRWLTKTPETSPVRADKEGNP